MFKKKTLLYLFCFFFIIGSYFAVNIKVKEVCRDIPRVIKSINSLGLAQLYTCKNHIGHVWSGWYNSGCISQFIAKTSNAQATHKPYSILIYRTWIIPFLSQAEQVLLARAWLIGCFRISIVRLSCMIIFLQDTNLH